ncbi:prolyl oligopeptidase family serine peptidase [Candidatus Aminicenantes bacterium AC-335-A11]|jgi:prolyl oligopeptidase|nr:prolyl oligopeptidase family serine peptidase [SCandidatus Aminicenantes bacterium Aminicenantia_JdfR_composite]MCP2597316.1 prolyl oligopeptidase family serine peptidase [Candidatus Aminicenantes bacterium AC-335-G13]MCP2598440.1 prolyl oligopeptidase family serine peptidase [Candidatus Aminicenantes bacterium AC-335-L06]MCP2605701.1 prolyl oligopeptidase family serine peptidase [Candidatus Aminicenantes bacterium AC-335-O07]MCP2618720.1 prolyl oligopeptidase family serine peptidase [Candid
MSINNKKVIRGLIVILFLIASLLQLQNCKKEEIKIPPPPQTKIVPVKEVIHGVEIVDPYRWLEDQYSPETRKWIELQNEYTDSLLKPLPGREEFRKLVSSLLKIDTVGVPIERGGRYFFYKRSADQELPVIYMREGLEGKDQVLIDPHPLSKDKTISVNIQDISKDGTILAYGIRRGGEDEIEIKILDINKRQNFPDTLPKARYFGISITPDKKGFYYTKHNPEGPRIYYHAMGTSISEDKQIFGKGYGPDKILYASLSEDGRWLLIHVLYGASADITEIYLKDLIADKPIYPVVKNIPARFEGEIGGNTLFIQTNWEAPNGRIFAVNPENPEIESWKEIIPEKDAVIRGFSLAGHKIFVNYLKNVKSKVEIYKPDGTFVREITFPIIGSVSNISGRWDSNEAFFAFSSFHIPSTIYRYDISTGMKDIWAKVKIPVNIEKFEIKQVWYRSKDGTKIPMFIIYPKNIELNGNNPTLLTGYGGFNISLTPRFSPRAVAWLEKGGVYAVANLRGGGEFGEEWHRAGMRENKQNVFDDFIAAAEYLIKEKYTRPEKLAIMGGSNGGLLVGAVMTQRPELFRAVVCTYPLLDMIRYHKFLVARYWVPEYGSSENPEQFKYLLAYSPYHNVKKGERYPAVLFITGDADTRVAPLHARKMAALMQASTSSGKPVLLRYHTKAGHSGGQPVSQQIEDLVDILSFLLWQLEEI